MFTKRPPFFERAKNAVLRKSGKRKKKRKSSKKKRIKEKAKKESQVWPVLDDEESSENRLQMRAEMHIYTPKNTSPASTKRQLPAFHERHTRERASVGAFSDGARPPSTNGTRVREQLPIRYA